MIDCDGQGCEHYWVEECPDPSDPGDLAKHPAVIAGYPAFYICKRCDAWTPFDADADSEFDDDDFDDDDFDDESDVYEGPFARGTSACDGLCLPQCDWCLVGHLCPDECGGGAECPYVSLAKEQYEKRRADPC